jgi:hypothetical protein
MVLERMPKLIEGIHVAGYTMDKCKRSQNESRFQVSLHLQWYHLLFFISTIDLASGRRYLSQAFRIYLESSYQECQNLLKGLR